MKTNKTVVSEREKKAAGRRKKKSMELLKTKALVTKSKTIVKKSLVKVLKKIAKRAVKAATKKITVKRLVKKPVKVVTKKLVNKKPAPKPLSLGPVKLPVEPAEKKVQLRIPSKRRRLVTEDTSDHTKAVTYVTCLNCGRVHFQKSRYEAKEEVTHFNEFLEKATPETRELFGNTPASIETYERCFGCTGSYRYFRETEEGDAPAGVTLTAIIDRFQ